MPARDFPNLGLKGGYAEHEGGWADDMNANLLKLSALSQATVISKVSATPSSPDSGDVYLFDEDHPTNANAVAIYEGPALDEAWTYVTPKEGWLVYNQDENYYEKFNGLVWAELATGGGGGGGADLPDLSDNAGKVLAVNADETGTEWIEQAAGGGGGRRSVVAKVRVNAASDGTLTLVDPFNIQSVVKTALGRYTVTFKRPIPEGCVLLSHGVFGYGASSNAMLLTGLRRNVSVTPLSTTEAHIGVWAEGYGEAGFDINEGGSTGGFIYLEFVDPTVQPSAGGGGGGSDPLFVAGGSFEFTNAGETVFSDLKGCVVERVAEGRYKVTFDEPMLDSSYGVLASGKWSTEEVGNFSTPSVGLDRGYAGGSLTPEFFYLVAEEHTSAGANYDVRISFVVFESAAKLVAGGGGNGIRDYTNSIDRPPNNPSDLDDEFNGDALASAWEWVNQVNGGISGTAVVKNGSLRMSLSAPQGGQNNRLLVKDRPITTDPFDIITKVRLSSGYAMSYHTAGLLLYNPATGGHHVTKLQYRAAAEPNVGWIYWNNPTASGAENNFKTNFNSMYLRIYSDGINISFGSSPDGIDWYYWQGYPVADLNNFTQFGFVSGCENGTYLNVSVFEWIRYYEGGYPGEPDL